MKNPRRGCRGLCSVTYKRWDIGCLPAQCKNCLQPEKWACRHRGSGQLHRPAHRHRHRTGAGTGDKPAAAGCRHPGRHGTRHRHYGRCLHLPVMYKIIKLLFNYLIRIKHYCDPADVSAVTTHFISVFSEKIVRLRYLRKARSSPL